MLNKETKLPTPTDIDKIYSRSLNFNDFTVIFDYKNEYLNSSRDVHILGIEKVKSMLNDKLPDEQTETLGNKSSIKKYERQLVNVGFHSTSDMAYDLNLYCHEEIPPSVENGCDLNKEIDPYANSDDSLADPDYVPDEECRTASPQSVNNLLDNCLPEPSSTIIQHCEYVNCCNEAYSACGKCLCLLCFLHFEDDISYNDCQQHKIYNLTSNISPTLIENAARLPNDINDGEVVLQNDNQSKGLTKDGNPRKRKKFVETLQQRKEKKIRLATEKLNLKEPCSEKCIKKCTIKINEEQRRKIHDEYISLSWEARGLFMKSLVDCKNIARKKTQTIHETKVRNITYTYFFNIEKEKIEVCKTFFLTTLGYNSKNDRRLHFALKKPANQQKDQRGKYLRSDVINKDIIIADINTYEPSNSHYRREHAPLRLYLPSDLTISSMHENFCKKYPNLQVSYEAYRQVLRKNMNISFAHLGNEECEVCAHHKQHAQTLNNLDTSCSYCEKFNDHKIKYTQTRKEYKRDVIKASEKNSNTCFYSVDLQKIVMLPRMEQFKAAIFCPRIIAYNESFVPLGSSKREDLPFAAVWNESISGRKQADIISTMRQFFLFKRDKKHIILWMDNCSSQNKNWALYSFIIEIINSNLIATETITLKYLEPGHTFMSADNFHHHVEQSLQKKGKVYDFNDFVNAVKQAQKPNEVKVMEVPNFFKYSDLSSQHKIRKLNPRIYLKDIMVILAKRGSYTLDFKNNHDDDVYQTLDFLQLKYIKSRHFPDVKQRTVPRGVKESTKLSIIEKLVHLMPENRQSFWLELPISTELEDDPDDAT